jgi:predicted transcriptional regulator
MAIPAPDRSVGGKHAWFGVVPCQQRIQTSSAIIGRYERNETTPSVEAAAKIGDALDGSLVYLVGASSLMVKDKGTSKNPGYFATQIL